MAPVSMYPPPSRCRSDGLGRSSFRCRTLVFGSGVGVAVLIRELGFRDVLWRAAAISTPLPKHGLA